MVANFSFFIKHPISLKYNNDKHIFLEFLVCRNFMHEILRLKYSFDRTKAIWITLRVSLESCHQITYYGYNRNLWLIRVYDSCHVSVTASRHQRSVKMKYNEFLDTPMNIGNASIEKWKFSTNCKNRYSFIKN